MNKEGLLSHLNVDQHVCPHCGNIRWTFDVNSIVCANCKEPYHKRIDIGVNTVKPVQKVTIDRQRTHGDFQHYATVAQALKQPIKDHTDSFSSLHAEALEAICGKMARIITGDPDFKDHWDDLAGYAMRVSERL